MHRPPANVMQPWIRLPACASLLGSGANTPRRRWANLWISWAVDADGLYEILSGNAIDDGQDWEVLVGNAVLVLLLLLAILGGHIVMISALEAYWIAKVSSDA